MGLVHRGLAVRLLALAVGVGAGCSDEPTSRPAKTGRAIPTAAPAVATASAMDEPGLVRRPSRPTAQLPPSGPSLVKGVESGGASRSLPEGEIPRCEPLQRAVKGAWASYAGLDGFALRYEVIGVQGGVVRTRVQAWLAGKPLGQPAVREDPRDLDPLLGKHPHNPPVSTRGSASETGLANRGSSPAQGGRASPVVIEAAGRRWDAWLHEDEWTDEGVRYRRRTWVSPQVAVFGIVRMELYGDGTLESRLELNGSGGR